MFPIPGEISWLLFWFLLSSGVLFQAISLALRR